MNVISTVVDNGGLVWPGQSLPCSLFCVMVPAVTTVPWWAVIPDVFSTLFVQDPPVSSLVPTARQAMVSVRDLRDQAAASPGGAGKMSPTTVVRHPAAAQSRVATKVIVPVFPSLETSPGTMSSAVTRQLRRYVPSSPIAVAGSSGAVFGVVAATTEDVAVALPPLPDLLLGVPATVLVDGRVADRPGGGTGAPLGATPPMVAGVSAAEVTDDCAVLPDAEIGANSVGAAG